MNRFSSRLSAAALVAALMLGTALSVTPVSPAHAEGADAAPSQGGTAPVIDRRGFDRARVFDDNRDRFRGDRGFERRGSYTYYNGHRGYRSRRDGYREYNGFWFPLAAFAAGALIAGAAAPAPAVAVPVNPHTDWCARTYRSYNPYDNTFQPYRGPRAYCISPYS